jgi:hypothetical protein
MKSLDDQERLILYLAGELDGPEREELEERLGRDAALRSELEALKGTLQLTQQAVPQEPSEAYWRGFWARLQPRLQKGNLWSRLAEFITPKQGLRLAAGVASLAVLLAAALILLHQTTVPQETAPAITRATVKIERTEGYFELAAGGHLERSRLLLQEVINIADNGPPPQEIIFDNQRRGEELLSENRTFRMAAERHEELELAFLLGELETVLMDIANIDPEIAQEALSSLQRRIERKELLKKIDLAKLGERPEERPPDREVI